MPEALDATNLRILQLLQENARMSNAEIARIVGIAPSAVYERIRKLEASGVIRGYEARIDPRALGLGLTAFVSVRTDDRWGDLDTARKLAELPEVQEIHGIAGEDCYLVKVRAADTEALVKVLSEKFSSLGPVRSTRTTIVLRTVKETSKLPVRAPEAVKARVRP